MSTSYVSAKTEKKILKGKCFEIAMLLPKLVDSEDEGKKGNSKECSNYGFGEWVRHFHTLMAIRWSTLLVNYTGC